MDASPYVDLYRRQCRERREEEEEVGGGSRPPFPGPGAEASDDAIESYLRRCNAHLLDESELADWVVYLDINRWVEGTGGACRCPSSLPLHPQPLRQRRRL